MTSDANSGAKTMRPPASGDPGQAGLLPPDDPYAETASQADVASQWQLMRWKFSRHRAAMIALWVVGFIYFVAAFSEILAPLDPNKTSGKYQYAPPMRVHFFADDSWTWAPHVHNYAVETDKRTFRRTYTADPDKTVPVGFFVRGAEYRFWGLLNWDVHLIGPLNPSDPFFLLGTDRLGRDTR